MMGFTRTHWIQARGEEAGQEKEREIKNRLNFLYFILRLLDSDDHVLALHHYPIFFFCGL